MADLARLSGPIRAEGLLEVGVLVCLCGGLVLTPEPVWALTFYLGVMPLCLWRLWRGRGVAIDPGLGLALAVILWTVATLLWGQDPDHRRSIKYLWNGVATLVFTLALIQSFETDGRVRPLQQMAGLPVLAAGLSALVAILYHLATQPLVERLRGLGETRHSILGASVMGTFYVLALARVSAGGRFRWATAAAGVMMLSFITLTQSRGPLFAALAASITYLILARPRSGALIGAGVLAAVAGSGLIVVGGAWSHLLDPLVERGTSYRLDIWRETVHEILERPWFGHGPAAAMSVAEYTFPHNLFLSTLFYTGAVGLGLLLALIGWMGWGIARRVPVADRAVLAALLVHALASGLTDLGQIIKGPGPLWYILWLPFTLILTGIRTGRRGVAR